jgi:RNA polymerase sigma-70 factor (ECF subfamily)
MSASSAAAQLVHDHYLAAYGYAYRLTGSTSEAEDLVQETFCVAQQQLATLREPSRAKAWLFAILRNVYLQQLRTGRRRRPQSLDDLPDIAEQAPDEPPEIDPQRLQQALEELPEIYRTPLILFYFEDFSYRDIAEQMDLPIGTVMSRIARARSFLRGRLASEQVSSPPQRQGGSNNGL